MQLIHALPQISKLLYRSASAPSSLIFGTIKSQHVSRRTSCGRCSPLEHCFHQACSRGILQCFRGQFQYHSRNRPCLLQSRASPKPRFVNRLLERVLENIPSGKGGAGSETQQPACCAVNTRLPHRCFWRSCRSRCCWRVQRPSHSRRCVSSHPLRSVRTRIHQPLHASCLHLTTSNKRPDNPLHQSSTSMLKYVLHVCPLHCPQRARRAVQAR